MIPKKIWTVWFGDKLPDVARKSIASQNIPGYEHFVITEENFKKDSPVEIVGAPEYVKIALANKKWVKAADYLRAWVLYTYGGIFLDADQEILPGKNFDLFLETAMFVGREENGFLGYSLVGSEAQHPLWEDYMQQVAERFTPLDGKNFESSMELFTNLALVKYGKEVFIVEPTVFFPYNHQTGKIDVRDNTVSFHHFMKSWTDASPDILPTVSIIIPQLGRPEGLKRVLESIDKLYYPKHLVEILIEEGDETVPVKVEKAFKKSKGDLLVYASNDIEFAPESLYEAVKLTKEYGLVSFNTGTVLPDEGNINEHFIITRALANSLGGIFDIDFHHVGCDNLLWARAKEQGQATRAEKAIVKHYHFSKDTTLYDAIYEKGWSETEKDRALLTEKLKATQHAKNEHYDS